MSSTKGAGTDIDVIVVNYRTPTDLARFLESVELAAGDVEYRLHVANVCPTDADLKVVEQDGRAIHHVQFADNVGYARAVNYCAARSDADVLGIFNADVTLSQDSLANCSSALQSNDRWGVLSPLQVNLAHKITHAGIFGTNEAPRHRGWKEPCTPGRYDDIREDAVTLSGSALFVDRRCWDEMYACPVFEQAFPTAQGAFILTPHYYEETGFIYHARHHGWKAVYYGQVRIIHEWHQASPVGGSADKKMKQSQQIFRSFMDAHGISRD